MAVMSKLILALPWLVAPACAQLPYNPTQVFLSSKNNNAYAYVVEPPSSSSPQGQLLSVSTASTLKDTNIPTNIISSALPFVEGSFTSYTTVLNADGSLMALAGNCSAGPTGSELWMFTPSSPVVSNGAGTWTQQALDNKGLASSRGLSGANYLAAGISFSANTSRADTAMYIFGGMCPFQNSTAATWASAAAYSSQMLTFMPESSSTYDFTATSGQGQPIAEAGFTITPLQPSYSLASDGSKLQQRQFLLLGGQTRTAFINMSQVALYSLPMASWTFLPINTPQVTSDGSAAVVEPRSGHTALMTADGTRIVVFGGWVGDTTMPASPQLAILEIGAGYGGTGAWEWTLPIAGDTSLAPAAGIYGHGAVMLSGDIMWVTGGYQITNDTSGTSKRATATTNNFFYNVTSNTWISTYNPKTAGSSSPSRQKQASGLSSSQKAGLGAGIPLGLLALGLTILGAWFYARKKQRQRQARHSRRQLIDPSNPDFGSYQSPHEDHEKSHPYSHGEEPYSPDLWGQVDSMHDQTWTTMPSSNHGPGGANLDPPPPSGWRRADVRDATGTGLYLDLPSPNRGLRRPGAARGTYHNVSQLGDSINSHHPTIIGPIEEEHDEDGDVTFDHPSPLEDAAGVAPRLPEMTQTTPLDIFTGAPILDPFRDPEPSVPSAEMLIPRKELRRKSPFDPAEASAGNTPERQRSTATTSIRSRTAAAPVAHSHNHSASMSASDHSHSPERILRNSLSFDSQHSQLSTRPGPADIDTLLHKHSAPLLRPRRSNLGYGYTTIYEGAAEETSGRPSDSSTSHRETDSFNTAQTSFSRHRREADAANIFPYAHEADALLPYDIEHPYTDGGAEPNLDPDADPDSDFHRTSARPRSPLRSRSRLGGWVGSVRRAIPRTLSTIGARSGSGSLFITTSGPRHHAAGQVVGPDGYYTDAAPDGHLASASASSSPTKRSAGVGFGPGPGAGAGAAWAKSPRRSVSDGASVMLAGRSKRAARHWPPDPLPLSAPPLPPPAPHELRGGRSWESGSAAWSGGAGARSRDVSPGLLDLDDDDLEAAIEDRVVQVMFTVPRERLRVVNADVGVGEEGEGEGDGEGRRVGSRGGSSGGGGAAPGNGAGAEVGAVEGGWRAVGAGRAREIVERVVSAGVSEA